MYINLDAHRQNETRDTHMHEGSGGERKRETEPKSQTRIHFRDFKCSCIVAIVDDIEHETTIIAAPLEFFHSKSFETFHLFLFGAMQTVTVRYKSVHVAGTGLMRSALSLSFINVHAHCTMHTQ